MGDQSIYNRDSMGDQSIYNTLDIPLNLDSLYMDLVDIPLNLDSLYMDLVDVEEMYLMIKLSKSISWIPKKSIANFINSIYSDLYECRKSDLLDKTINNLPDHIQIEELKV
jgi:hypothetical protein